MRYEIKSIGIWAYLKIAFFLNLVIGFIGGIFFAVVFTFELAVMQRLGMDTMPGTSLEGLPFGLLMIIFPIIFAIGGAVFYTLFGLIFVAIYNLIARLTGGFEMELREVAPVSMPPTQPHAVPPEVPQVQPAYPPPPPPQQPSVPPPPPSEPPPAPPTDSDERPPTDGDYPR